MPYDLAQIRSGLQEAFGDARRGTLLFSVLTILLTPVFMSAAVVGFIYFMAEHRTVNSRVN